MQVKKLTLTNVRAFKQAEFEFQPGMNLLVGVNGAGKSTVLDVIRRIYARLMPGSTKGSTAWKPDTDISVGQEFMTVTAELDFYEKTINYTGQIQRERTLEVPDATTGQVRDTVYVVSALDEFLGPDKRPISKSISSSLHPLLTVFYSPNRSVLDAKKGTSSSTRNRATVLALEPREINVQELAQWWLVQDRLSNNPQTYFPLFEAEPKNLLAALTKSLHSFLDTYGEIEATDNPKPTLRIGKGSMSIDILELSDGERSMIALILDLARRLALANPNLGDPLRKGRAVVLIDEIDLHLHPGWQRIVCERLTNTFPNCQFIATTHSPQIIGEVEANRIILIEGGNLIHPYQARGMDTNWILRNVMGTKDRDQSTIVKIKAIEALIDNTEYDDALSKITELRSFLGGQDEELTGLESRIASIRFFQNDDEYIDDDEDDENGDTE